MSIQKVAEYFFPAGNFAQIRANAPDRATYNIESTRDLVENQPLLMTPFAPVGAAAMSIPYDLVQASMRARDTFFKDNPTAFGITDDAEVPIGPSMVDFASAVAAENPIDSLVERTKGATTGLANRLARAPEFLNNLIFTPLGADSDMVPTKPEDDLMDYDEFYDMPEEKKREGILSRILDFIPLVGDKSLSGILLNALGGAKDKLTGFRDAIGTRLGPASYGTSQAVFNAMTPSQQQAVGSIYGPGGIMQGYNAISAFGRGPVGAIQNRINNIIERKYAGKNYSKTNLAKLQNALKQVGGEDSTGGGDYSQAPGRASAAAQEASNRDAARGR
jgi:hypothetical protein